MIVGAVLSAAWLVLVLIFWVLSPVADQGAGGLARLMTVVAVLLPVVLIWTAVTLARGIAVLRAEARQLRAQMDALREAAPTAVAQPAVRPAQTAPQAAPSRQAPAAPAAPRRAAPEPRADARQPQLFDPPPGPADLPLPDLLRALNFPDGPQDQAAIRSLRLALQTAELSRLLRAAQDVVTLLAQSGVYMDDLPADGAGRPDLWRRFAAGERGDAVAPLAAALDDASVEIAGMMMRSDEVFRDVAHHFLRHFDRLLTAKAPDFDDDTLAGFADTRSARAFALLARVTGMLG